VGEGAVDDGLIEPGGGRRHPAWRLRILHDGESFALEELEASGPAEWVGGDFQHPPAPAGGPYGGLDVDDGHLGAGGLPEFHEVDMGPLVDRGHHQHRGVPIELAIE
jgi:hypothetical protein